MLHTFDVNARDCHSGEAGKKYAAHGVAQRVAESAFQRLDHKPAVAAVLANFDAFDTGFFDFECHFVLPSLVGSSVHP
jgi:hypothetical protein